MARLIIRDLFHGTHNSVLINSKFSEYTVIVAIRYINYCLKAKITFSYVIIVINHEYYKYVIFLDKLLIMNHKKLLGKTVILIGV